MQLMRLRPRARKICAWDCVRGAVYCLQLEQRGEEFWRPSLHVARLGAEHTSPRIHPGSVFPACRWWWCVWWRGEERTEVCVCGVWGGRGSGRELCHVTSCPVLDALQPRPWLRSRTPNVKHFKIRVELCQSHFDLCSSSCDPRRLCRLSIHSTPPVA